MREFLHTDDLGRACVYLLENYNDEVAINLGVGEDIAIKHLAELIRGIVGFQGEIVWDNTKPDGTPRKLLDVSRITALGWKPEINLEDGIRSTYEWFKRHRGLAV
jgi:GDP-L-fucose synthase